MAEGDYQRLAAACHCGKPARLATGPGRPPRHCEEHRYRGKESKPVERGCAGCSASFVTSRQGQRFCSKRCAARIKMRTKRGGKPRDEKRAHVCAQCYKQFESAHAAPMYCSRTCKQAAYESRHQRARAKKLCAYFAGHCHKCGVAHGSRWRWGVCPACRRADALAAARAAAVAVAVAKHKAAGRTTACDECTAVFCPLYGSSSATLCSVCAEARERANRRASKAKRRAVECGADAEKVDPFKVFERDGWRCQLCKVKTPRKKRGTYDDDAPELDHIVPLAKGGAHTYANTQCACRRCNGLKSDKVLGQALLFG